MDQGIDYEKLSERIENRMLEVGILQTELAARIGTSKAELSRWLSGARHPGIDRIMQIAQALDCNWKTLIDGVVVPIVGKVGAGDQVFNFDDSGPLDFVTPPDGAEKSVAVIVQGDSMLPKYDPGARLFFFPSDTISPDCIGKPCIVQVRNGATLVKRLHLTAKPGLYRLSSTRAEDMNDVDVLWAARVRWVEEP